MSDKSHEKKIPSPASATKRWGPLGDVIAVSDEFNL
jgi:hypothetical protein